MQVAYIAFCRWSFCVCLEITDVRSCLLPIFYRRWRFALKNRLSYIWRINMAYTKPQVIAQNASSGSYVAGCGANASGPGGAGRTGCVVCERTR